jgi:hypothetical protein
VLQYLCCEVAALQESGQLPKLRMFDIAAMTWRMQTTCDVEAAMHAHEQVGRAKKYNASHTAALA